MFNLNFTYLLEILIPPILRKEKLRAWLKLISSQIRKIYDDYVVNRTYWKYDINFTGQVCYLEQKLREILKCPNIHIIDHEANETTHFYNIDEIELPNYIINTNEDAESNFLINYLEINTNTHFVVKACSTIDINLLKIYVEKYKLIEKNYKIEIE